MERESRIQFKAHREICEFFSSIILTNESGGWPETELGFAFSAEVVYVAGINYRYLLCICFKPTFLCGGRWGERFFRFTKALV